MAHQQEDPTFLVQKSQVDPSRVEEVLQLRETPCQESIPGMEREEKETCGNWCSCGNWLFFFFFVFFVSFK